MFYLNWPIKLCYCSTAFMLSIQYIGELACSFIKNTQQ